MHAGKHSRLCTEAEYGEKNEDEKDLSVSRQLFPVEDSPGSKAAVLPRPQTDSADTGQRQERAADRIKEILLPRPDRLLRTVMQHQRQRKKGQRLKEKIERQQVPGVGNAEQRTQG